MSNKKSGTDPVSNGIGFRNDCVLAAVTLFACIAFQSAWAGPFAAEFELAGLLPANGGDGSAGFIINGANADDISGIAVASGDLNDDGIADMIIGASEASPDGRFRAGDTYVVFGIDTGYPAAIELFDLLAVNGGDGSRGFVLRGIDPGDFSGMSLSAGADLNDDGIVDLIIGADLADSAAEGADAGVSYVIFGRDSGFPAEIELASLLSVNGGDGSSGFVIKGVDFGDFAGTVASGGDFNGDMVDDVIIGARDADPDGMGNAGETYLVFGSAAGFAAEFSLSSLLPANGGDGSAGVVIAGVNALDQSGTAIDNAGDINGDQIDDIIISAPEADAAGNNFAGEVYVVFGRSSGFPAQLQLSALASGNGSTGFVLYGETSNLLTGRSVSGAGDLNGDDIDDILLGADLAVGGAGRAYVVFGRDTGFPATFPLTSLLAANGGDGSAGFVMDGITPTDDTGRVVSDIGDINNDGFDDIAIAAYFASPGGASAAGSTYVIYGSGDDFPAELALSSLLAANGGDGSIGFAIHGMDEGDVSGIALSAAGDVDGDTIDDFIIGAAFADPDARDLAGESYVILGRAAVSDMDGDGIADIDDNCPGVANAEQSDDDDDSIGNLCDNCILRSNPDQLDTNNDAIGNVCDPDVVGDLGDPDTNNCTVDFFDVAAFKAAFLTTPSSANWNPDTDMDGDQFIGFLDLGVLKEFFLVSPGPSANGCN